jgi:1,4-alpha-glucan branching enzyme
MMSIRKRYLNKDSFCTVTFSLSKAGAGAANAVYLVGDFNGWDREANPLKRQKNGSFAASLTLERGREYQFRYLLDGERWQNDWKADKYLRNEYGDDNSVVIV